MQLLCVLFIIFNAVICLSAPMETLSELDSDPEMTDGYFEGDILLDVNRNGMRNENTRWPNGTVYYVFNTVFDEDHRNHILRAMREIEQVSCIRFVEVGSDHPYYVFIDGTEDGCHSNAGWLNRTQSLNLRIFPLQTGCFILGKIIHELFHTLGFRHMHSNWNRDDYVLIVEENINPKRLHNFKKFDHSVVDDFGVEYDYGSIMHYSPKAGTNNGQPTIVPLRQLAAGIIMGQRRAMSQSDIQKLNRMYKCSVNR